MDIELLKTFVEVHRTLHFGRAAENLYLTQSAVSARVRLLEHNVGVPLFTRSRNNIQLTPAGQQLLPHAETILGTWSRARQQITARQDERISMVVGGTPSLWDFLLQEWLNGVCTTQPELVVQAEIHGQEVLQRRLLNGTLDVAFTFDPPQGDGIVVREIAHVPLLMASSEMDVASSEAMGGRYVFVDWGISFSIAHTHHFPDMSTPTVRVALARMALELILAHGGSAYFAEPMIAEQLSAGHLHRVVNAPRIDRFAYAAYRVGVHRRAEIERCLCLFPGYPGSA
jgi:DNA-binding transcriptional LysR family regulator